MPKPNSKAHTLFASLLCAAAVSISAPAVAGSHSAYVTTIDERATALGCNFIKTNRNLKQLQTGLKLAGVFVFPMTQYPYFWASGKQGAVQDKGGGNLLQDR